MSQEELLRLLAEAGRGNDTALAHITPEQAALLKKRGGSGTINPVTGLPEFDDFGGFDFGYADYGGYDYGGGYSYDPGPSYDYSTPSYDYSTPSYDYGYYNPPSYDYMPDYSQDYLTPPTYDYSTPTYDPYIPTYDYSTPTYDPTYDYSTPTYDAGTGADYSGITGEIGTVTPTEPIIPEVVAPTFDFTGAVDYTTPTYESPIEPISFVAPEITLPTFETPYLSTPTFGGSQFVTTPTFGESLGTPDVNAPEATIPSVDLLTPGPEQTPEATTQDQTQTVENTLLPQGRSLATELLQQETYNPYESAVNPATQILPEDQQNQADLPALNAQEAASRILPSNIDFTTIREPFSDVTGKSRDMAIRTIAAESGNNDAEALGIANVIRNRVEKGTWGGTIDSVVTAKSQFSPWGLPQNHPNYPMNISTSDPRYARAEQAYDKAFNQGVNNVGNVVGFYAPGLINEPSWARQGAAYDIGSTRFVSTPGTSFFPPSGNVAQVAPPVPLPPERPAIFAENIPPIPQPPQREAPITAIAGETFPPSQKYTMPSQYAGTAPQFLPNLTPTDQQILEAYTRTTLPVLPGGNIPALPGGSLPAMPGGNVAVLPGGTPEAATGIASLPQAPVEQPAPAQTVPAQPTGPAPGSWEALAQLARQGYNYVTGQSGEPQTQVTVGPPSGNVVDARTLIAANSTTPTQASVTSSVVEDLVANAPVVTPQQRAEEEILQAGVPPEAVPTRTVRAGEVAFPQGVPDIMNAEPGSDFTERPIQSVSSTTTEGSGETTTPGPIDKVSDWVSGTVKDAVNNPVKTATNIGVGMIPGVGLVNTLSGLLGGPTAGGILNDMVKGGGSGGGGGGYIVAGGPTSVSLSFSGGGGGGGGYPAPPPEATQENPTPALVRPVNIRPGEFNYPSTTVVPTNYTQARSVDLSGVRSLPQSFVQTYSEMPALPQYAYYDFSQFGPRRLAEGGIVSLKR